MSRIRYLHSCRIGTAALEATNGVPAIPLDKFEEVEPTESTACPRVTIPPAADSDFEYVSDSNNAFTVIRTPTSSIDLTVDEHECTEADDSTFAFLKASIAKQAEETKVNEQAISSLKKALDMALKDVQEKEQEMEAMKVESAASRMKHAREIETKDYQISKLVKKVGEAKTKPPTPIPNYKLGAGMTSAPFVTDPEFHLNGVCLSYIYNA